MSDPLTIEQAEASATIARRKLGSIEALIREEKRKASEAIDEKHRTTLAEAKSEVFEAEKAVQAAKDRLPDHPWTGKRVWRNQETRRHSWETSRPVRIEGVVETRRSDTQFPGNVGSYSIPKIGEGFVRLINKDGKPGKKFEGMTSWGPKWELVEEPAPRSGDEGDDAR